MKLSEAIREGAKLRPQAFGDYIREVEDPAHPGHYLTYTCAQGAAFEVIAGELPESQWKEKRVNPTLCKVCGVGNKRLSHPQFGRMCVLSMVGLLNDDARWTREQIADWLEERGY